MSEEISREEIAALLARESEEITMGKEDAISRQAVLEIVEREQNKGDALSEIEKLPSVTPKQRWIPVSERLPENRREVLVTDVETSDTYLSRYIGDGYWECDNGLFKDRIIAWQPKPQSYKAESEG